MISCDIYEIRGFVNSSILSQRAGFGEAPQQAFLRAYGPAKISECGHTRIACRFVRFLYMARKNGGRVFLRSLRFPGFSDTLCGSLDND